jgi:surface protein
MERMFEGSQFSRDISDWDVGNVNPEKRSDYIALLMNKKGKSTKIVVNNDNIREVVKSEIKLFGNQANLNHIDVSNVTNMSRLFRNSYFNGDISDWDVSSVTDMASMFGSKVLISSDPRQIIKNMRHAKNKFNGDISDWDVGNVTNMERMFAGSQFNGDMSDWDVKNVRSMKQMFSIAYVDEDEMLNVLENINPFAFAVGAINSFDTSIFTFQRDVDYAINNIATSMFNKDISDWDVGNVTNMERMFEWSQFNGDVSDWDVSNVRNMTHFSLGSRFKKLPPKWDKEYYLISVMQEQKEELQTLRQEQNSREYLQGIEEQGEALQNIFNMWR